MGLQILIGFFSSLLIVLHCMTTVHFVDSPIAGRLVCVQSGATMHIQVTSLCVPSIHFGEVGGKYFGKEWLGLC